MIRFRTVAALAALALTTVLSTADGSFANDGCCAPAPVCCAPAPVCCPPAPIQTVLCVAPPCSSCPQNVTVCIPGCCTEPPTVCWRSGVFGRQIGTYTWASCGHTVKVVVNRRGNVKVRG